MNISQTGEQRAHPVKRRVHTAKTAIRMDFTPMVDLGFLLITFFMLTTSLQQKRIVQLVMPDKKGDQIEPVKASKTLTLLLGKNDQIYFYRGLGDLGIDSCSYEKEGLRRMIFEAKRAVEMQFGAAINAEGEAKSHLVVLIKPTEFSVFQNIIDVLDELEITGVSKYALVDVSPEDRAFFQHF